MVNVKAYSPQQILSELAALRAQLAHLQQNATIGSMAAFDPVLGDGTPETWHTFTIDAGYTSTNPTVYRLMPWNAVWIYCDLTHAAITGATNVNGSNPLPSQYWPIGTRSIGGPLYPTSRCGAEISASGVIIAEPLGQSCTGVNINGFYPIDV